MLLYIIFLYYCISVFYSLFLLVVKSKYLIVMKRVLIYFKMFQYCRDHVIIRCAHPVFWSYSPIPNEVLDELGLVHDYYIERSVDEDQFSLICDIVPYVSHY